MGEPRPPGDPLARRIVVIDNYDSFTYNAVHLLGSLGARCEVVLNDGVSLEEIERLEPDGILLSPGPGTPDDAGITLAAIARFADCVPLFGLCLGHQALGQHFGAQVRRAERPMHGKVCAVTHDGRGLFRRVPNPAAFARYNSLVLDEASLPEVLEVSARSAQGEVMAIRHRFRALEAVQFHPESTLSEHGPLLFANWLESLPVGARGQADEQRPTCAGALAKPLTTRV